MMEFEQVFDQQLAECREILLDRAGQYAEDDDRMHNFRVAAALQGCSMIRALGGMMAKHSVSIYDLIRRADDGLDIPIELWAEKITDSINYLLLLRVAVEEDWRNRRVNAREGY